VQRAIRDHLDRRGFQDIEMRVINKYPWSKVSAKSPPTQAMIQTYRDMGREPVIFPINIGSAPFYVFDRMIGIPYVFGGLGHGGRAHSNNEYCVVSGILDFEKSMVAFLDNYLQMAR
jgi:acetylornithine deacetylase/succinyl-diaminopimelate desuccinylase-like protein